MKGTLDLVNVADLVLAIYQEKRSGVLRLVQGEIKKNVYFLEGAIVFAHSNLKQDRLGETFLRLGKITQEEFETASQDVIQNGKRLGQAVSDRGYLSPGEVVSGVNYQLQQIIYSLFDWDRGEYEFIEKDRPVFEDIIVEISTPALLIDGIRNIVNPVVLKRSFHEDETLVVFLQDQNPKFTRPDLDFSEETLLACVDSKKTIRALKTLTRLAPMEFDRAICSLLLCGMVTLSRATETEMDTAVMPSEDTPLFEEIELTDSEVMKQPSSPFATQPMKEKTPAPDMPLQTYSEEQMRNLILSTENKYREASDEEVLSVLPHASKEEIKGAYNHFTALYQPSFNSGTRFLDLKDQLKFIIRRIAVAYENLMEISKVQHPLHMGAPSVVIEEPAVSATVKESDQAPEIKADNAAKEKEWTILELNDLLRKEPANIVLMRRLATKLADAGKVQEAEKQLLRALEMGPQNVDNHLALGEFYQARGLKMKAFKHLNIVLQLHPDHDRAMELLGLTKQKKKALYEISSQSE